MSLIEGFVSPISSSTASSPKPATALRLPCHVNVHIDGSTNPHQAVWFLIVRLACFLRDKYAPIIADFDEGSIELHLQPDEQLQRDASLLAGTKITLWHHATRGFTCSARLRLHSMWDEVEIVVDREGRWLPLSSEAVPYWTEVFGRYTTGPQWRVQPNSVYDFHHSEKGFCSKVLGMRKDNPDIQNALTYLSWMKELVHNDKELDDMWTKCLMSRVPSALLSATLLCIQLVAIRREGPLITLRRTELTKTKFVTDIKVDPRTQTRPDRHSVLTLQVEFEWPVNRGTLTFQDLDLPLPTLVLQILVATRDAPHAKEDIKLRFLSGEVCDLFPSLSLVVQNARDPEITGWQFLHAWSEAAVEAQRAGKALEVVLPDGRHFTRELWHNLNAPLESLLFAYDRDRYVDADRREEIPSD